MSVAGVTGTAQGSPYSLRRTLGLDSSRLPSTPPTTAQGSTASLSWSHTVAAGTNRLLLVRTAHRDGNKTVSSVKYGAASLTKVAEQNGPGNQNKATCGPSSTRRSARPRSSVTLSGSVEGRRRGDDLTGVRPDDARRKLRHLRRRVDVGFAHGHHVPGELVVDAVAANGDALSATA